VIWYAILGVLAVVGVDASVAGYHTTSMDGSSSGMAHPLPFVMVEHILGAQSDIDTMLTGAVLQTRIQNWSGESPDRV